MCYLNRPIIYTFYDTSYDFQVLRTSFDFYTTFACSEIQREE